MKEYQGDLQVIIDLIRAYGEKYELDTREALIKVYALIPDRKPMQEQKPTRKNKAGEKDYYDSWLDAIKKMGEQKRGEK